MEHAAKTPTIQSGTHIFPLNGATSRVPVEATAFGRRDALFSVVISGVWPDASDNDTNIRWVREYYDAIQPHCEKGAYVNFLDHDDQEVVRASYGVNYERIARAKAKYDPRNLFRMNQNIVPAT
jgi:FAD/FMN-containing dehydrogenase